MSYSRHKLALKHPLRDVVVRDGFETLISERKSRQMIEERYRVGFEAGQKALGEQLIEQRKQLLELQSGILRSLENALPGIVAECERSIVLLALESARRVVQQIPIDAALVEGVVRSALQELQEAAEYEVLLHPADLASLQKVQSGLLPSSENTKVRFVADSRIAPGDCLVNTRHGSIAATREHMFAQIESAVL